MIEYSHKSVSQARTWSPAFNAVHNVAAIAPIPDEVEAQASPPSKAATFFF